MAISLNVRTTGPDSGQSIVILHGLFGSGDNWASFARELPDHYRVLLPDLPNHGESPHTDRADYEAMSAAVAQLLTEIEKRDGSPPILAGHSMGAKVAMQIVLRDLVAISALIVFDMAPRRYEASHGEIFEAMRSLVGEDGLVRVDSRRGADAALAGLIPDRSVRSFLLKNLVPSDDSYRWRINLPVLERDYEQILDWPEPRRDSVATEAADTNSGGTSVAYTGPTMFVGGDRSSYLVPERDRELISARFPNAEIKTIAEAGHWIHSDRREELAAVVSRFLKDACQT